MVFDKARFIVEEVCDYGNHKLRFGSLDNSISKKWYLLNEHNEVYELAEYRCGKTPTFRFFDVGDPASGKHFFKKKIEKTRIREKSVISVIIKRKL